MGAGEFIPCVTLWFCLHHPICLSEGFFTDRCVFTAVWVVPSHKTPTLEQLLCPWSGSGLVALEGQMDPIDPQALQLFLQHILQDGAQFLEVWGSLQGFQQLPHRGVLLPEVGAGASTGQGWGTFLPLGGSQQPQSKEFLVPTAYMSLEKSNFLP